MVKKRWIAKSPVRALMKENGAKIVSADGINYLLEWIENKAVEVTEKALTFTHHAKRKKLNKNDIKLAISF